MSARAVDGGEAIAERFETIRRRVHTAVGMSGAELAFLSECPPDTPAFAVVKVERGTWAWTPVAVFVEFKAAKESLRTHQLCITPADDFVYVILPATLDPVGLGRRHPPPVPDVIGQGEPNED